MEIVEPNVPGRFIRDVLEVAETVAALTARQSYYPEKNSGNQQESLLHEFALGARKSELTGLAARRIFMPCLWDRHIHTHGGTRSVF
jgi:hypothetical protein